ncbi:MAG: hypothetical protein J5J00_11325 [Deltaproteobacteria bacterium]|nr:hypothetical protein [Deltaproteobacteria bacterium]
MYRLLIPLALYLVLLFSASCSPARPRQSENPLTEQVQLTTGMSQEEVVRSLGDPSVVTRDGSAKETWVYDGRVSGLTEGEDAGSYNLTVVRDDGVVNALHSGKNPYKFYSISVSFGADDLVDNVSYQP